MQHLWALLGISALLGAWVLFQAWMKKKDKGYRGYQAGCGSCGQGSCSTTGKMGCGLGGKES